jgi:7-cyano-7-deazaguanine synthase
MAKQRDTVVNYRNSIFILFAAGLALQEDCDEIVLGVNFDDFQNYHDCRPIFFEMIQNTIQAGITNPVIGSENFEDDLILKEGVRVLDPTKIDIKISTPLIHETKRQTVKRIVEKYGLHVYKNSWSCYNGGLGEFNSKPCLVCPACRERIDAFEFNGYNDPAGY